jgi:hypothetical protein
MISDFFGPLDRPADDLSRATDLGEAAEVHSILEDATSEGGSSEADEPGTADALSELADADIQNRLWLRALVPLLQLRAQEADPSDRVQFALDRMHIAACERVARILRSDLPPDRV